MKTNKIWNFAVAGLVAVALAACSSSEVETTPQTPQVQEFSGDSVVVFSSATNATRTSMGRDANGEGKIPFYWTINGEKIWVKTGESSYAESDDFTITAADKSAADFIFHENLPGDDELPVLYTGNYSSSATSVSIWKDQVQTAWNNSDHIGHSGDCGTATATRTSRHKYTFQLEHKAAYLIFKPYKQAEGITDDWKLKRIIITTTDGSSLCGTYPFSMDGIDINGVTSAKDTVYLYCGWDDGNTVSGFSIPTQASDVCFAVIQPGTHTNLKIEYEVMPTGTVNGFPKKIFSVFQTISVADYNPNSVTIISCDVSKGIMRFEPDDYDYRQWGATDTYANTYSPTSPYGNFNNNPVPPFFQLDSEGWKDLPNANEMSWYMLKGDVRIDTVALWYADGTGAHVGTLGCWIKKRASIDGFNGNSSPYGVDLCSVDNSDKQYIVGTEQYAYYKYNLKTKQDQYTADIPDDDQLRLTDTLRHAGRPADTTAYFFLPQISTNPSDTENYTLKGIGTIMSTRYWLRSPSKRTNGTFGSTNYRRMTYAFRFLEPFSIADNPSDERRRFADLSSWVRRADAGILAPKWFK